MSKISYFLNHLTIRHQITIGYFVCFISLGMVRSSLGPTLSGLAEHTGVGPNEISVLFTALALGNIIGDFGGGHLYDRYPGHPILALALLVISTVMGISPIISVLWWLAAIMLLLGTAQGTLETGINTMLVWVNRRKTGLYMSALHFSYGIGALLSPIIVAQAVLLSADINLAYWFLAIIILPAVIWIIRLPSPSMEKIIEDEKVRIDKFQVFMVTLLFFIYGGGDVSFSGWIYTYAVSMNLGDKVTAAYLTSTFWIALTLGRLLSIPLSARLRPRQILLMDFIGTLLFVGLIGIFPHSQSILWIGTFGVGFSMASVFPTILILAQRRMQITGRITGWFLFGASLGAMSIPWLVGQLFTRIGPQVVISIVFLDISLSFCIFMAYVYFTRNKVERA